MINNQSTLKKWNVGLKVSHEEERKIKIKAIKEGMRVSEYIKKLVMQDLMLNNSSTQGK